MKMIEVFDLMAEGKIKEGTKLIFSDVFEEFEYKYRKKYRTFVDENLDGLDKEFILDESFLNREVDLILPKPKKYLVKLNIRGLKKHFRYLNYYKTNDSDGILIHTKSCIDLAKTNFTKSELQSIQPVREFLEDMEGKYELIEVEDNETD